MKAKIRRYYSVLLLALLLAFCFPGERGRESGANFQVLVEFRPGGGPGPLNFRPSADFLSGILRDGGAKSSLDVIAVPAYVGPAFIARTYVVPVEIPGENLSKLLTELRKTGRVVGVHLDPQLLRNQSTRSQCEAPYPGDEEDEILSAIGIPELRRRGLYGEGVIVAVVDAGFNIGYVKASHPDIKFESGLSMSTTGSLAGEASINSHGTMSAFLAAFVAPRATLVDMASLADLEKRCEGALRAYEHLAGQMGGFSLLPGYRGLVVTNSWATGNIDARGIPLDSCGVNEMLPTGRGIVSPDRPCHVINRAIAALEAAGADIIFAAGNSGACEPSSGGSIFGPNSSSRVLTVAAVDLERRRIWNSSHGPGSLIGLKPDIAFYSNVEISRTTRVFGSGRFLDQETSAATALMAGVVAVIRSSVGPPGNGPTPAELREELRRATKRDVIRSNGSSLRLRGFHREFGWGVFEIDLFDRLRTTQR